MPLIILLFRIKDLKSIVTKVCVKKLLLFKMQFNILHFVLKITTMNKFTIKYMLFHL